MEFIKEVLLFFIAGAIAMLVHELPKLLTIRLLTHPIHKSKNTKLPKFWTCIDPIGLITFPFTGIGWQKPFDYNASKFIKKEKGIVAVTLTGILANLMVVTALIPLFPIVPVGIIRDFVYVTIYTNFSLVVVNLLPVPPLDMSRFIYAFSPNAYFKLIQNERVIHVIFIFLIIIGIVSYLTFTLFNYSVAYFLR